MNFSTHRGRPTRWLRRGFVASVLMLAAALPCAAATDRIRIEIDGVDSIMAANVRSYLTLSRYTQREDLTDPQVRRLADRAVDEAADALRPFGYYEPIVRSRTSRDDENWVVRLKITTGAPVLMRDVEVLLSGEGAGLPAMTGIAPRSTLQPGARLDHGAYERLKAELLRTALDLGFLDARLTRHELEVDPANVRADARIALDTGGRYEFGEVRIEQDAVDPQLLQGFVRFAQGQPYSSERIRSTQYALEDSNYFAKVSVSPGERDPQALTVPVTIRGEKIKRNRYGVGVGYGTDTGFRGQFSWDNRLVNTHGHRWRVETTLSQVLQEAVARYVIPIGDPTLEKLEFSTGYVNEDIGDLESSRIELMAGLTQVFGLWQRVLFLKLNQERTVFPDDTETDALLLIPGLSYASLPPNFLTGWVRDAAYYVELTGSPQSLGSDASYLRFYSRAEKVWSISGPWHLRLRGEFGTSWVSDFSELPASQRFFAGGDRSVRGFALDELSPVDPEQLTDPATRKGVGGENKIVGSIELERDLPRDFRGALFFDAGNAFTDWDTPLEYSVGIGVRWKLPMLLIGLDVAQALSEPGKKPRFHLNITQVL